MEPGLSRRKLPLIDLPGLDPRTRHQRLTISRGAICLILRLTGAAGRTATPTAHRYPLAGTIGPQRPAGISQIVDASQPTTISKDNSTKRGSARRRMQCRLGVNSTSLSSVHYEFRAETGRSHVLQDEVCSPRDSCPRDIATSGT
jgi:hypothetical protein